jgi:homogentisate 1,2-dioxygenase
MDTEANFMPINPRVHISPTQLAWLPFDIQKEAAIYFIAGLKTIAGSGDPTLREGLATHVYTANTSMSQKAFVNSDGDFLIIPQQGSLDIQTEFGPLFVQPGEICVIQRGQRFHVELPDGPSPGYILEVWGANFELPELGPLGANGLANTRDFLSPKSSTRSRRSDGRLCISWVASFSRVHKDIPHSTLWHGMGIM